MKANIHPTFHPSATVTCACGAVWTAGSTEKEIRTEICSSCHPFFTGKQNLVDTLGRVERFQKKASSKTVSATAKPKKAKVTTALSHTQIKAAMRGQKAVKVKQVLTAKEKKAKA